MHRRMEMKFHFQITGYQLSLIQTKAAITANIQLLQRNHIRIGQRNHSGDTLHIHFTVQADATVHVVGHHP